MKTLKTGPNAVTSLVAVDVDTLFNSSNCARIFKADGSYQSWTPGADLNAFTALEIGVGYIAIMLEELDVTDTFSDGIASVGNPNYYYITNLSPDSLDIVSVDNHATIFRTLAAGTATKLTAADFTPYPDGLAIIPNGANYKGVNLETVFNGSFNTNKYQIAPTGSQFIKPLLLQYGDCFLAILPDASGAGTWT